MQKGKDFEKFVKEYDELDCVLFLLLIFLCIFGYCTGYFAGEIPNHLISIIGYGIGVISTLAFILKSIFEKPAENKAYLKVPVGNVLNSEIDYCVKEQVNSNKNEQLKTIIIHSVYLRYYFLKIEDVTNVEESIDVLSKLPREFIVKNLLSRIDQESDSIADILGAPVHVVRTTYGVEGDWKVLFDEISEVIEAEEEIARYIPKKKVNM